MQSFNAAAIFESMGHDTSKANAPAGGRTTVVGSFKSQWDATHHYTIVGAGKAGDTSTGEIAEDVRSTAQGGRLNEWYAADCKGGCSHGTAPHRIVFGADARPTSEFNKYGKAHHATIATPDSVPLARIRTAVKAMPAPRATFAKLPPVGAVFASAKRDAPVLPAGSQSAPQLPAGK